MNASICYVGGSKGGVGKSMMSYVLTDYLIGNGKQVLLVESDTSNPDIFKAHETYTNENLICEIMDLDTSDGWLNLVDKAEDYPEHMIVINSAARSNTGISKYGSTLKTTLPQLQRELVTFWMINRQLDSVELLKEFVNAIHEGKLHVCRNLYFGDSEKFDVYNSSRAKEIIEMTGGTFDFPALSPRVADRLYSERVPIWIAENTFRISERAELARWKNLCLQLLKTAFGENNS